ncbi:MAG: flagellar biosynthesis protein FlgN [Treponema sp.]|jgi:hypothetical protein|nr:flagellar biosynthesis protein FlgN [Treponema sp.]
MAIAVEQHSVKYVETGIAPEELRQRVSILKRFRELLTAQRERFQNYLEVLDKQKDSIEKGTTEELENHVELEENIVADIFSIQKVIKPLEEMYDVFPALSGRQVFPSTGRELSVDTLKGQMLGDEADIKGLKSALETLQNEAAARIERNKELLSVRMTEIRGEMKMYRGLYQKVRTAAYTASQTATLVDISG